MEVQVKELLESIQKDGVEAAEKEAQKIIEKAHKEAEGITADARKEAQKIVEDARKDAAKLEQSAKAALQHASRDTILALEKKIIAVCDAALLGETKKSMKPEELAELAAEVVRSEALSASDVSIEFSKDDAKKLQELLKKSLEPEMKKGLELKVSGAVSSGFIIRQKDGEAYYDFTTKEIADMLSVYVNPYLSEIIREAAQKGA
jgi:V/A-type H+-transporting ATPase subunit E